MRVSLNERGEESHFQWKTSVCLYFRRLQVYHAAKVLLLFENNIWTEQYFVHAGDEKWVGQIFVQTSSQQLLTDF